MTTETQKPNPNQFVTQCAIACGEPLFAAFLKEKHPEAWSAAMENADPASKKPTPTLAVYELIGIKSRTELRTDPAKIELWKPIFSDYELWKIDV